MKGMVAAENGLGILQNQLMTKTDAGRVEINAPRHWRRELKFLKNKYRLLERLLELSYMRSNIPTRQTEGEIFRQECALFVNSILPDFEDKYEEYLERLECLELLPDSSSSDRSQQQLQQLQHDWNELQKEHQRLELKLLNTFIRKYPVSIF
jgi:hypothetical protein